MKGTVTFKNLDRYIAWVESIGLEGWRNIVAAINRERDKELFPNATEPKLARDISAAVSSLYTVHFWSSHPPENTPEAKWPATIGATIQKLRTLYRMSSEMGQPVFLKFWYSLENGTLAPSSEATKTALAEYGITSIAGIYTGNEDRFFVLFNPEKVVDVTKTEDYSVMSPMELRMRLSTPREGNSQQLIPAEAEMLSKPTVRAALEQENARLNDVEQEIRSVQDGSASELAELMEQMKKIKQKLDAKKTEMMAELERKKEELEEKKEELENQIFLLDSQIYSILCYAGETVKFTAIRTGRNAPDTEPIVVYQKLRFLDEDLARMVSLYEIDWSEMDLFEDFLHHAPGALEMFAPNERCVMLVRLSKSGKKIADSNDISGMTNMLEKYDYYHGKTVGIIIRNGENLYIGWTDEDRIHIDDDLLISKSSVQETVTAENVPNFEFAGDRECYLKEQKKKEREAKKTIMDGLVSRNYIYQILQGVIDRTPMLPLPEGVKLNRQSEYVVYAVADLWLSDTRFGSFTDIVDRANSKVTKGDIILTVQSLHPVYGKYAQDSPWENDRGRGERNRTHDVNISDCTLYPVNLVEWDDTEYYLFYRMEDGKTLYRVRRPYGFKLPHGVELIPGDEPGTMKFKLSGDVSELDISKAYGLSSRVKPLYEKGESNFHVFVSAKKTSCWRDYANDNARANFELYSNEYVNLSA